MNLSSPLTVPYIYMEQSTPRLCGLPVILRTLSKNDDGGSENVGKKNEFAFFQP